jgi:tetratricopeptide (TPR) repeat protein
MSEERFKMIQNMLEENPEDSFLNYAAALELHKRGRTPQAIEIIEQIIGRDPDYLGAYYQLGKLLEGENKIERAIDIYKAGKIIAKALDDKKTLSEISEALMMIDDDDDDDEF